MEDCGKERNELIFVVVLGLSFKVLFTSALLVGKLFCFLKYTHIIFKIFIFFLFILNIGSM